MHSLVTLGEVLIPLLKRVQDVPIKFDYEEEFLRICERPASIPLAEDIMLVAQEVLDEVKS